MLREKMILVREDLNLKDADTPMEDQLDGSDSEEED